MIHRRHVIYVQGYDPRGLAGYYRMFRTDYGRFLKLYGLKGSIARQPDTPARPSNDPPNTPSITPSSTWTATTHGGGWTVTSTYEFLRWEDIIRRDFERPAIWATLAALWVISGLAVQRRIPSHCARPLAVRPVHRLSVRPAGRLVPIGCADSRRNRLACRAIRDSIAVARLAGTGRGHRDLRCRHPPYRTHHVHDLSVPGHGLDRAIRPAPTAGLGRTPGCVRPMRRGCRSQQRNRRTRGGRTQFGFFSRGRCSGARPRPRSRSRPARPARGAPDPRRQPADCRLPAAGRLVPPADCPGRERAIRRLDRLSVTPRHHELLPLRPRVRSRTSNRTANASIRRSFRCSSAISSAPSASAGCAGTSSTCISSSCGPTNGHTPMITS